GAARLNGGGTLRLRPRHRAPESAETGAPHAPSVPQERPIARRWREAEGSGGKVATRRVPALRGLLGTGFLRPLVRPGPHHQRRRTISDAHHASTPDPSAEPQG